MTAVRAIIQELNNRGYASESLDGTDAILVNVDGHHTYFINDMTPLVPYIYGIFVTQPVYLEALFMNSDLYYDPSKYTDAQTHAVITSDGYLASNALVAGKTRQLAEAVLQLFPHARYIGVTLDANHVITDVSFNLDRFNGALFDNGQQQREMVLVIADLICEQ